MKRLINIVILAITVIFIFNSFSFAYVSDYDQGKEHGFPVGEFIGDLYGKDDFSDGKNNAWQNAIPNNNKIIEMFNLSRETSTYRASFINGFREGFEKGYKNGFRWESNIELVIEPDNTGILDGIQIGGLVGQRAGEADFHEGKSSDWQRVLPSDNRITIDYNLNREVVSYRGSFLEGFKKAFKASYVIGFRQANLKSIMEEINKVEEYIDVSMAGGSVISNDKLFTLDFEPGTLYRENKLRILEKRLDTIGYSSNLLPATEEYQISIKNRYIFPNKPFKISFQYFGLQSAGIYQLINNKWTYLPSEFDGHKIYTIVDASYYRGGEYAVFINKELKEITDIEGHWADKELNYFNHMNYLKTNQNNQYKPDGVMLRGEFIYLLDKVYGWTDSSKKNLSIFKDYGILGEYEASFSKAFGLGYISGYSDYTLRSHLPISYQEVESIMRKVLTNGSFKWSDISEKLQKEKDFFSKGGRNTSNYISKAEAIYLLYNYR